MEKKLTTGINISSSSIRLKQTNGSLELPEQATKRRSNSLSTPRNRKSSSLPRRRSSRSLERKINTLTTLDEGCVLHKGVKKSMERLSDKTLSNAPANKDPEMFPVLRPTLMEIVDDSKGTSETEDIHRHVIAPHRKGQSRNGSKSRSHLRSNSSSRGGLDTDLRSKKTVA